MKTILKFGLAAITTLVTHSAAAGIISEFDSLSAFNTAVGAHTTINFQGFDNSTIIDSQFSGLGATFTDGTDVIVNSTSFVSDGAGLAGHNDIHISFSSLMNFIGVEFPGGVVFDLFLDTEFVGSSSEFGDTGTGYFGGLLSTAFNRVVITDPKDNLAHIDNLHFGSINSIPEPVTLALLGLGFAGIGFTRKYK